jgi:hypothetical protein
MQRKSKNYSKKNNIILFLTVFILFGYEEIVSPTFDIPVSFKMYVLLLLASVNYVILSNINIIRLSIIGLILSFFIITDHYFLFGKSMFRFIILMISFASLDIIVSRVKIDSFEKTILYISLVFIVISILLFFDKKDMLNRFRGLGVNYIVIGIYSGLILVFSNHIKNKYIKVMIQLLAFYAGFMSGSRAFLVFVIIYVIFNIKDIVKYIPLFFMYYAFKQSEINIMLSGFYYRIFDVEDRPNSRTGIMKLFLEDYEFTLFGNGLGTTSYLKKDNMAHSYNDMPSVIHILNDFGLVPLILFSILYFVVMVFLYKKGDSNSMKMMLVFATLAIISSNPVTPANAGFYLVWMGIFSIMNKYKYIFHQNPIEKTTGTTC